MAFITLLVFVLLQIVHSLMELLARAVTLTLSSKMSSVMLEIARSMQIIICVYSARMGLNCTPT